MFHGLTHAALADILASVTPLELKGVALLKQSHPQPFYPADVDPAALVEATVELIDYSRACHTARQRLADLRPVPLKDVAVAEFSV